MQIIQFKILKVKSSYHYQSDIEGKGNLGANTKFKRATIYIVPGSSFV